MKTIRIATFAAVTVVVPALLVAQDVQYATAPHGGEWAETIERARFMVDSVRRANNVPGISIAVSVVGEIVWSEGFGFANVEGQVPVTPVTKFRIGSVSKPLTAVGSALLVEEGRLDLDAPIQQYVPDFPEKGKGTITTRLLGGHLAGVRHYSGEDEFLSSRRYASVREGLEIFKDDTLKTPPGTEFSYSSYGWNLISAVMERASGADFLPFMRERVFRPLGMRNTVADYTDSIIVGRTGYYQREDDGVIVNAPYVDNSYKWGGGGFLSTPEDLLKFANALMLDGFLKPETLKWLWTSQKDAGGEDTGYGFGFGVGSVSGVQRATHGGGSVGGNSWLGLLPEEGIALAITSNISGAGWRNVPAQILSLFLEAERNNQ